MAKQQESTRFVVKTPVEGKDDKTFWRSIGSLWHNPATDDHAESITIRLDALPINGQMRAWLPEAAE